MILAFFDGAGQAGGFLLLGVILLGVIAYLATVYRPHPAVGSSRSTEVHLFRWFKTILKDESKPLS